MRILPLLTTAVILAGAGRSVQSVQPIGAALDALSALTDAAAGKRPLDAGELSNDVNTIEQVARSLPADDNTFLPNLVALPLRQAKSAIPTRQKPVKTQDAQARARIALEAIALGNVPLDKTPVNPASAEFPGSLPANAPLVTRAIEVDTGVPGWHSTGLYAPPGKAIHVTITDSVAGRKLQVRIGAHKDKLWKKDAWSRYPEITNERPIDKPGIAANAFGGPIYIVVPTDCRLGVIRVTIANGAEAPYYVLDKTSLDIWRRTIRNAPAPWAELESRKVVLTVPSSVVRTLDDPQQLMKFWDRAVDAEDDLAGTAAQRQRPERYVIDVEISAGYMHSGYPIMVSMGSSQHCTADEMVHIPEFAAQGKASGWGFWHEMGHNHQSRAWTFDGTGEVTCNIFSLYVCDKVCGLSPSAAHKGISEQSIEKNMGKYFGAGADFVEWKKNPFLALIMYHQLQEAFGWDAYKKVFAEYRDLPPAQRPKDDAERRDQWIVRLSRVVGHNLGPFFQAWGIPTSESARKSVASLTPWMPKDFPPKKM